MRSMCVGHITVDDHGTPHIYGGSAYYGALVYQALGAQSMLATAYGRDISLPEEIEPWVVHRRLGDRTTHFTNVYDADGGRQQILHARAPDVVLPNSLPAADVIHLAPVFGECDLGSLGRLKQFQVRALNIQGFIRRCGSTEPDSGREVTWSRGPVVPRKWMPSRAELAHVDVVFLSEEDLMGQTGLLNRLRDEVPLVVCTAGARGATLYTASSQLDVASYPTVARDPTGAGDAFAAGFMYGLLAGAELRTAMLTGSAVASVIIEDVGTRSMGRVSGQLSERMARISALS